MIIAGFVLTFLTIICVATQIISHRWVKKITNCYFFWLVIGTFWFIWLVVFRFGPDWSRYCNYKIIDPGAYQDSIVISKAFLLDACPFAALAICVALMFDPTRKAARAIAPISLLGGCITIFSLAFDSDVGAELTAKFIFIGDSDNKCYFIMHFLMIVLSVGVMLNTPRYGWKGMLLSFMIGVLYYSYVGVVMAISGCAWNVSGLSINDWTSGEYHMVSEIFNIPPKICPFVGIPVLFIAGFALAAIKDFVFNKNYFAYGNAYSGRWFVWYNYHKFVKQRIL